MSAMEAMRVGCHGRMRQRIVALGLSGASRRGSSRVMRDRYFRTLLRRGTITAEQVQNAIEGLTTVPSRFAWMADIDEAMLDRADCVFLADYGRFPTEDADFQLSGPYHRICRGLEYDWHYYDEQLHGLYRDEDGNLFARSADRVTLVEEPRAIELRKGSAWASGAVLAVGVLGGPALALLIARTVSGDLTSALSVFGVIWAISFAGLLAVTWPRRVPCQSATRRCSRCGRGASQDEPMGCPGCGALFEAQAQASASDNPAG